jgi:alkylation response protein AidB-like acyl-CoA dehydrogenase
VATTVQHEKKIDSADEEALLNMIDRWIDRDVRPIVKKFDHADEWPEHIVDQMAEFGLFGATISQRYGGLGVPATTYAKLVMKISAVWMSITGIFNSHLMLALAIEKFGTEAQKEKWLPKLASGEVRGGLALTEPDAGTDQNDRKKDRRSLCHQRNQDVDIQWHPRVGVRSSR